MSASTAQKGVEELILPLLVVTIVGMMVLPLPLALLDLLLGGNIAFSLLLLLASVHTKDPERFTTLPSILLLSTIFRLGLNISTTRQLLTHGEAPRVVAAFGEFVVGGNVLVGFVVFLIISLVQFIVVSKGAERVAEVAARFTLDAMPGKQMAIDADIRAGILSLGEAKLRRVELQRESKLFGALDGAMKFVKGDAVAALCITVINITAGFFVGVYQLELPVVEALNRYTLFTIGESLVAQIPALLVSVAAGVAVTRVGESEGLSMGRALLVQLGAEPRVLGALGAILCGLALCPGIPVFIFTGLGMLAVFMATKQALRSRTAARSEIDLAFSPRTLSPLLIEVGSDSRSRLLAEGRLASRITELRRNLFEDTGILVPEPEWELMAQSLPDWVGIRFEGAVVASLRLGELREIGTAEGATSSIVSLLENEIRSRMPELIDDTQTRMLLDLLSTTSEDLVSSIIPKQIPVTLLTRILRDLAVEGVSVRNLKTILQALGEFCLSSGAPEVTLHEGKYSQMLAFVRSKLKRQIAKTLAADDEQLKVWELAPRLDRLLAQATAGGLPPSSSLIDPVLSSLRGLPQGAVPIVLCSPLARRAMAQLGRASEINLRAVAAGELPENWKIEFLGVLGSDFSVEADDAANVRPLHREAA